MAKSHSDTKKAMSLFAKSPRYQDYICIDLIRLLNPIPLRHSEGSQILIWRIFASALPTYSHEPPSFWLGTSGYTRNSKPLKPTYDGQPRLEGVPYTDHSDNEQHRNQQPERQQEELDLNSMTNDGTGVDNANVDLGPIQNGRPQPRVANPVGQRIASAIDRRWFSGTSHNREQRRSLSSQPFREIGSDEFRII
ncbi:hypothetical protein PIB30_016765 [Stylosanthes scabra]|uniref:Uncharacterized protein n=1 Tax=Stylosanthes scabra TaxID=79078 RepID=A0ABU6Q870_9FABA|nr:hypothetical protein [Stylosanthes scabra]